MATVKGSTAEAVADGVRALEETGAAVKGAVVADIDSPIGNAHDTNTGCDRDCGLQTQ